MSGAHHQPWDLTDAQRARYRQISQKSREAKLAALSGRGPAPLHDINKPKLDPLALMPERPQSGLTALSLFSGGGGLDLGFHRAGFSHMASYEILPHAAMTLQKAWPEWDVFGGPEGDVTQVDWRRYRGEIAVLHGGPPCQPFSAAGRQRGATDSRDMFPEFVRAVRTIRPSAFVAENVPALLQRKFTDYLARTVLEPLGRDYVIHRSVLDAQAFGVPQVRRRVIFVGFRSREAAERFRVPSPTHSYRELPNLALPRCMGAREALGLPNIGVDGPAPTLRSTLTGPRHTTSVINSVSAQRRWNELQIWPNGVAPSRENAQAFVARNGHFRLSVPDCAVLQGFPEDWPFQGATYMMLGQVGNAVAPPMAYAIARAVSDAMRGG